MRKILVLISILVLTNTVLEAQQNSTFGKDFTPHGDLRILYVAVRFGVDRDGENIDKTAGSSVDSLWNWDKPFSEEVLNKKAFYFDYSDFPAFPPTISDADFNNVSLWYYVMSGGKFRMIVDTVAVTLNLANKPSTTRVPNYGWNVFAALKARHEDPTDRFFWCNYDLRCHPRFNQPCSTNGIPCDTNPDAIGDKMIDYIVVHYRWAGSYAIGGEVGTGGVNVNGFNTGTGHRQYKANRSLLGLFIHEVAHELYNCPHYGNANQVTLPRFYGQHGGWGAMKLDEFQVNTPFKTDNAWERWYLGWTELKADIKFNNITSTGIEFTLRDYVTTGDAARIEIPSELNASGQVIKTQRLWLENRQGKSGFDKRLCDIVPVRKKDDTVDTHYTVPPITKGIYAYIERYCSQQRYSECAF